MCKETGSEAIYSRKFSVPFRINSADGLIDLNGESSVGYVVNLKINGLEYEENRSKIDISLGEALPTLVTVPGHRVETSGRDGPCVWYQLFVKTTAGEELMIEKRYSEINMLDALVRSQTAPHLSGSLPSLPGKIWNPFTDQTSETFIYQRRSALELYFAMLVGNAKVVHYQDMLCFFGLDPVTGLTRPVTVHSGSQGGDGHL